MTNTSNDECRQCSHTRYRYCFYKLKWYGEKNCLLLPGELVQLFVIRMARKICCILCVNMGGVGEVTGVPIVFVHKVLYKVQQYTIVTLYTCCTSSLPEANYYNLY